MESREEQDDTDRVEEPENQEREGWEIESQEREGWEIESQEREGWEVESQEFESRESQEFESRESQESIGRQERSRSQVRPRGPKSKSKSKVTELGNTKTSGKSKETR